MVRVILEGATAPAVLFRCRPDSEINTEEPLRYEAMTGLNHEQLTELVTRVHAVRGGGFSSRGRPYALGLFGSVALVMCVMRKNITQAFAAAIFGVSQSTVSRRWVWVPNWSSASCGLGVFVDQSPEPIATSDAKRGRCRRGWERLERRCLVQCPVRPVG